MFDFLRRQAFRRGVIGSSHGWFALWVGIGAARFAKKRFGREPVVVARIALKPGETIEIRDTGIHREAFPLT